MEVTGTGSILVAPDTVRVTASCISEGATVTNARTRNSQVVQTALRQVEALGLSNVGTRTLDYSMERMISTASVAVLMDPASWNLPWKVKPEFEPRVEVPVTLGYRAKNSLTVVLRDLPPEALSQGAGRIVDALMAGGCNQISSVDFTLERGDQSVARQALVKAVEDAQATADAVAGATRRRIIGISSIRPSYDTRTMRQSGPEGLEATTSITVGMVEIRAVVLVTFEFEYAPAEGTRP